MNPWRYVTVALLTVSAIALAQGGPPPDAPGRGLGPRGGGGADRGPGWAREDAREMVETLMMARLSRELKLNDEETVLMVRRIEEFKQKIGAKKRQRAELAKTLRESVESGAPDEEIQAKTRELMEADRAVAETRFGLFDEASKGLNAAQAARLYVFLSEFEDQMRKLVQRARARAAGGRGAWEEPPPGLPSPNPLPLTGGRGAWEGPPPEGGPPPAPGIGPRRDRPRRALPPQGGGGERRRNRAARRGGAWEPLEEAPEDVPPPVPPPAPEDVR